MHLQCGSCFFVVEQNENCRWVAEVKLEKLYNQNTAQNGKARQDVLEKIQSTEDQIRSDNRASALAELQDIKEDTDKQVTLIKIRYAQLKLAYWKAASQAEARAQR